MRDNDNRETADIGEQADRLQLKSRRRLDRTLPCDPVAEFDDVPAPGDGAPDDTIMDIDLSLRSLEPDPAAAQADPFRLDSDFASIGDLEIGLSDLSDLEDLEDL